MRIKNNIRTKLLALIFVILGLLLTIAAFVVDDFWVVKDNMYKIYKSITINICTTIAPILGLSAAWEIICKRSFSREILNLSEVSNNYIDSGIEHVYKSFKDINWKKELHGVKKFTIFLSYGYTWRNENRQVLKEFTKNNEFIVILPDYRDKNIVDELDKRFCYGNYSPTGENNRSTKELIEAAIIDFSNMGAKIKLYNGTICSTYYFMDDKCIYAPCKHDKEKFDMPAIKSIDSGIFYNFCYKDMQLILKGASSYKEASNEK